MLIKLAKLATWQNKISCYPPCSSWAHGQNEKSCYPPCRFSGPSAATNSTSFWFTTLPSSWPHSILKKPSDNIPTGGRCHCQVWYVCEINKAAHRFLVHSLVILLCFALFCGEHFIDCLPHCWWNNWGYMSCFLINPSLLSINMEFSSCTDPSSSLNKYIVYQQEEHISLTWNHHAIYI
jgi:hypothetical protein